MTFASALGRAPFARTLLVTLVAGALPQLAAAADAEPVKLEKIEVTGSHIKRVAAEGPSPIQVISRSDIEQSGVTTAAELLDTITANNNAGGQYRTNNTNNTVVGGSAVSLRGLGPNSTLVLLNGRRMAFYGFSDASVFVDLGSIPISAVERVEIVKDGASAIYGSDALAGVVNFILRRNYRGMDLRVTGGRSLTYKDNDYHTMTLSAGGGEGKLSLMGILEIHGSEPVQVSDRFGGRQGERTAMALAAGYTGTSLTTGTGIGGNFPSTSTSNGNWWSPNPNDNWKAGYYAAGACNAPNVLYSGTYNGYLAKGMCLDTETDRFNTLNPKTRKVSVFGRMGYDISATLSAFAELSAASIEQQYEYWPTFKNDYYDGDSTPHFPFAQAPAGWGYYARLYDELGPKLRDVSSESARLVAGLKGENAGWDWEAALTRATNSTDFLGTNYIRSDVWYDGIASGAINPFQRLTDANMAALKTTHTRAGTSSFTLFDVSASTELTQLPAGPLQLAVGASLRHEKMSDGIDAASNAGKVENASIRLPISASRSAQAAFAELSIPLAKTLESQVALRYDHFGDAGSSVNPKLALKWTPVAQLALRGSYTTGFRAPSLAEMHGGIRTYVNCVQATNPICPAPSQVWGNQVTVTFMDSPNLEPEKSKSSNLGLVWEPIKGHSISVDAWAIERRNQVYGPSIGNPLDVSWFTQIAPASNAAPAAFRAQYVNLGKTDVRGLDIALQSRWSLGEMGNLKASLTSSNMSQYEVEFRGAVTDYSGKYGYPKWRHRADLVWSNPKWTVALAGNHRGAFEQAVPGPNGSIIMVQSFTTMDAYVAYRGLAKGLSLAAGVGNLSGKKAPFDRLGRLGTLYEDNSDGRTGYMTLEYKY
ncbi:TonB-dependent receptor plug domain-containing protein [Inhella gelatinilytica]|uniref:TonB-dependent receptor n=1 Tax=Inhella gelatinilytica TaxID=2795030 RepID=A0A931J1A8_9BURK|nr:TonB-dependent receptor [Inhella gelatinilytica]MBH9554308.1 TonB-dependent receptor [Inhella gelatinilytica]